MRPTGRLHIGHFFGALQNWIKLHNDPQYECFFFIADWHALTSDYADTSQVAQNSIEIATDWLAAGLDPEHCTMFVQSAVPEHAELHLLLSMVTPLGWLERVPTYKEALDNVKDKDLHTYGFLGYPVLQTADIVMYGDPDTELIVPVGEDQVSHVELSREIVRRFNYYYGLEIERNFFKDKMRSIHADDALESDSIKIDRKLFEGSLPAFYVLAKLEGSFTTNTRVVEQGLSEEEKAGYESRIRKHIIEMGTENFLERIPLARQYFSSRGLREPDHMLTHTPRIPGTDGRKMSKSYGNFISLSESDESIRAKTKAMMTDPARKRRTDPGNPDVCPVYDWHKLFSPQETLEWSAHGCRTAGIGCIECKAAMADHLIKWIEPVRQRRKDYEQQPQHVLDILDTGSKRARMVAQQTMDRVREAVFGASKTRASNLAAAQGDVQNVKAEG
jgi:tryptophanyl-tRNA synthetase